MTFFVLLNNGLYWNEKNNCLIPAVYFSENNSATKQLWGLWTIE
jgi:hypothetical protein